MDFQQAESTDKDQQVTVLELETTTTTATNEREHCDEDDSDDDDDIIFIRRKVKSKLVIESDDEDDDQSSEKAIGQDTDKDDDNDDKDYDNDDKDDDIDDKDGDNDFIRRKVKSKFVIESDDEDNDQSSEKTTDKDDDKADDIVEDVIVEEFIIEDDTVEEIIIEDDTDDDDIDEDDAEDGDDAEDNDSDDSVKQRSVNKNRQRIRRLSSESPESSPPRIIFANPKKASNVVPKRKNIRRIIADDALDAETIAAQHAEEEKAKRMADKQRMYNQDEPTRLILDFGESGEVEVDPNFVKHLKPHQREGVRFMFDRTIESVAQLTTGQGSGGILAHTMGLGKSLQTVCFVHTVMTHPLLKSNFRRVLIIAPSNVIINWCDEFHKWIRGDMERIKIHESSKVPPKKRLEHFRKWHEQGGVLLITQTLFAILMDDRKGNPEYSGFLANPDLVVIDEAHLLKNEKCRLNRCVSQISTRRRIALTGTPLQNNLGEYFAMVNFVTPHLLGRKKEFSNRFENPINQGSHADSNERDVELMKKRVHILSRLLKDVTNRKDVRVLVSYLPPKMEYVLKIRMSDEQVKMYETYLRDWSDGQLFQDFTILGYIWNHPALAKSASGRSDSPTSGQFSSSDDDDEIQFIGEFDKELPTSGSDISTRIERSTKFMILIDILNRCEQIGDKIIVFSQSLNTLDLIEDILGQLKGSESKNLWIKNFDYLRIDGNTSVEQRMKFIKQFNDPSNRTRLMLISTRAGGVGTNLVGANRCILFDVSWNPANDSQAIYRIYRFGQSKPVYIYRFVSAGTMEQKVYERQVLKQSLSHRVVDEQQISRHFSQRNLQELYELNSDYDQMRVVPKIPDDRLLAQVHLEHKERIVDILEHDSLLENHPEEDLSEAERDRAWMEFRANPRDDPKMGYRSRQVDLREDDEQDVINLSDDEQEQDAHYDAQNDAQQKQIDPESPNYNYLVQMFNNLSTYFRQ